MARAGRQIVRRPTKRPACTPDGSRDHTDGRGANWGTSCSSTIATEALSSRAIGRAAPMLRCASLGAGDGNGVRSPIRNGATCAAASPAYPTAACRLREYRYRIWSRRADLASAGKCGHPSITTSTSVSAWTCDPVPENHQNSIRSLPGSRRGAGSRAGKQRPKASSLTRRSSMEP